MVSASIRQSGSASLIRLYAGPVPVVMILVCVVMMAPLLAIAVTATGDTADLMPHLLQTVLARYVGNTLLLMAGVGVLATLFGVSSAWVVSRYHFPGGMCLTGCWFCLQRCRPILSLTAILIFWNMPGRCKPH